MPRLRKPAPIEIGPANDFSFPENASMRGFAIAWCCYLEEENRLRSKLRLPLNYVRLQPPIIPDAEKDVR
jgi:hypothetical protein